MTTGKKKPASMGKGKPESDKKIESGKGKPVKKPAFLTPKKK